MPRSRILFLVILGAAILVVVAMTVIKPQIDLSNTTTIQVMYGTEKQYWFQDAVDRFQKAHPNIKVNLVEAGSMSAYQDLSQLRDTSTALPGNKAVPALWSPASEIQVSLLNTASKNALSRDLAVDCKRLVLSPLAIMVWQDRAKAFETYFKDKGGITFNNLYEALNGPTQGRWADLGGDPAWGLIKIGYTDPRESNSGMMLLMALANNYYGRATRVTGAEVGDPNFVKWLSTIANAMSQPLRSSSGTLMEDYVAKGPGSYDFVFVYEALAIEYFDKVIGRAGQALRIVYPQYNLYSDHPLCLIDHPAITAAQRDVAHEFQNFLLSPEIQKLALTYGFRPSDLNIPIFGAGTAFDKDALKTAGISANVGQEIAIPDGDTINNLLTQWRRNFAG